MEFWGVEVKSGERVVVEAEDCSILNLSRACLAEIKKDKGTEHVYLFAKVDDRKFVLGLLSSEQIPQISFNIVFGKTFELSHSSKNGAVHFIGYRISAPNEADESESEDETGLIQVETGISDVAKAKREKSKTKEEIGEDEERKVKALESIDNEDRSEEEVKAKKVGDTSMKRPSEDVTKTSADKKAKFVTPDKPGGNKARVVHVATPYPTKQVGTIACKNCNRTFGSDTALQSHTKAKHTST